MKIIVHFDKAGKEIATTRPVIGAVEATRYGLTAGEFDACVRAIRKGDEHALAAIIGEREHAMSEDDALQAIGGKAAVEGAVRFEVREAA